MGLGINLEDWGVLRPYSVQKFFDLWKLVFQVSWETVRPSFFLGMRMFGWTQGFTSIKCASFASMQIFKNCYLRLRFRYFKPWLENDFEAYYFLQVRYYYFCPTLTYRYPSSWPFLIWTTSCWLIPQIRPYWILTILMITPYLKEKTWPFNVKWQMPILNLTSRGTEFPEVTLRYHMESTWPL